MTTFDPYYQWLAIPPEEQPPNHYRLLGVPLFTADKQLLEVAADQRMTYVRQRAAWKYIEPAQKLLEELARARRTLLDPKARAAYEQSLREAQEGPEEPLPPAPVVVTPKASPKRSGALSGAMKVAPPDPPAEPPRPKPAKPVVDAGRSDVPWLLVIGGGLVGITVLIGLIAFFVGSRSSETGPVTKSDKPPETDRRPRIDVPKEVRIPEGRPWVMPLRLAHVAPPRTRWIYRFDGPAPAGCVLNRPTKPTEDWTLSWTPGEDVGGLEPQVVRIQAMTNDMSNKELSAECRVIVTEVDEPPVYTEVAKQLARQAEPWMLRLESRDPDFPPHKLAYRLRDPPPGLELNQDTGVLHWIPGEGAAGKTHRILIELRDAGPAGHVVPITIELEVLTPTRVAVLWRRDDGGASSDVVSTWVIDAERKSEEVSPPALRQRHPGLRPIALAPYRIIPERDDPTSETRYVVALRASSVAWRATPWDEFSDAGGPRNWLVDTVIAGDSVIEYQIAQPTIMGLATFSGEAGLRQYLDRLGPGFRTERILQLADGQLLAVSRQIASEYPREVVFLDEAAARAWANDHGLGTYEGKHPVWFEQSGGPGNRKYVMILDTALRASDWRFDLGVPLEDLPALTERRRAEAMVPVCLEVN